jgi:hypothetical protein
MAKVIVERPRIGSRLRGRGKGARRKLQRFPSDETPKREGMKRSVGPCRKLLNEHLGPLRRYLHKQIGRPWNKVFSEISQHISRDSAVQDHVRDHVLDYVATRVTIIDGVLCRGDGYGVGIPLGAWGNPLFYVCPRTGLLKRVRRQARRPRSAPPLKQVAVDFDRVYFRKDGLWLRVELEAFPKHPGLDHLGAPLRMEDALWQAGLTRAEAVARYGRAVFARQTHVATRADIRKYCEPLKRPNRV